MRPSLALSILVFFSFAGELRAAGVDLEVILSADVSRSIDDAEFELQRKGYAAALSDPRVLNAIHGRPGGSIGICFIEWSGEEEQQVVVDWTAIRDEEDAGVVATSIVAAPRSFAGRTPIARASISRWRNSPGRSGRSSGASSTFPAMAPTIPGAPLPRPATRRCPAG